MNRVYIISYDLKVPGKDYGGLYAALKSSTKWWHYLESSWLIYTTETTQALWDRLASYITKGDRLLIIEVRDNCQGWLPKDAWDWIHQHTPKP
jgi:hypothetical protein